MQTPSQKGRYQVMPASFLSDEPVDEHDSSSLRQDVSTHGVCFVQVIRSFHDGTNLARVAAHPELLPHQGFIVALTDAQILGMIRATEGHATPLDIVPVD